MDMDVLFVYHYSNVATILFIKYSASPDRDQNDTRRCVYNITTYKVFYRWAKY